MDTRIDTLTERARRARQTGASRDELLRIVSELSSAFDETRPARWRAKARTQAILDALDELEHPAGPAAIAAFLHGRGRDNDNPNIINATLSQLAKAGKVTRVSRGAWTLPGDTAAT